MRSFMLWLALTACAVVVGFAFAWLALLVVNASLPPFRFPEDDDTWRDYGPAILAYTTWGLTSLIGTVLASYWVRRHS